MISGFMQQLRLIWITIWGVLALIACTAVQPQNRPIPTPTLPVTVPLLYPTPMLNDIPTVPTLTPTAAVLISPTPMSDTDWQLLRPGLERRVIRLLDENERLQERLYFLRLEPELYRLTIAYRPGEAQSLAAWQAETGALLVVNGGFFTEGFVATGRIVVDGVGSGLSYRNFGGMLAITADSLEIRSLAERPYDPNEPLQYALQSFPLLVKPGGKLGFPEEDGLRGRRTVVALDRNGRLLFILAPNGSFTLHELSRYLVESDLNLDVALNLDGGTSTGLRLADPAEEIPAYVLLPVVIAIYPELAE